MTARYIDIFKVLENYLQEFLLRFLSAKARETGNFQPENAMTMCRIDGDVISNTEVFWHRLCLHSAYQLLSTSFITGVAVRGVLNVTYHVFLYGT